MLGTLVEAAFDREGWIFEIKWDGFRAIAEVDGGRVKLYSRNFTSFNERFAPVVTALEKLRHRAVLDGEIVAVDEKGRSSFQLLQNYQRTGEGRLRYVVFDILSLDGKDLKNLPLVERKKILKTVLPKSTLIMFSKHVAETGKSFFAAAKKAGLEGIMAKDGQSSYQVGVRSMAWQKIKTQQRQEAVIGGFTAPQGSRPHFGALVLGVYEQGKLVYIGHTGGGFDEADLAAVYKKMKPLVQEASPFAVVPKTNAPVHWVKPRLVCEVKFSEWTEEGLMRQPVFLGLRDDKAARDVRRERPKR